MDEYEKLSGLRYDPNLKIGTLLKGIPNDLKRTLLSDMDDKTTYERMRARLLEYERSSQTWSAENILSSLSVQNDHAKHKEDQGRIRRMEKEKAKEEKKKKTPPEKDMDLAAVAEEKKDAEAEKVEEKVEKKKESTLGKWVRKVTVEKESLVEKAKDLYASIVERQDILLQSVIRTPGKGKEKERVFGMFTESMRIGIKKVNNGMRNGRIR